MTDQEFLEKWNTAMKIREKMKGMPDHDLSSFALQVLNETGPDAASLVLALWLTLPPEAAAK
jgi:hypothetical protein